MQNTFNPPPSYASGQYALAMRREPEPADLYDFNRPNTTYGGFTPAEFAALPSTEADIDWLISSYGNAAAQPGLDNDDAEPEVDFSVLDFGSDTAQPQSHLEPDTGIEGHQQPESSTGQPKHRFEKKERRKGARVFTDDQLDIIQGMIEEDPSTKPCVIHRRLKEIDPSMTLSIRQVNGSVKEARRQRKKSESGMTTDRPMAERIRMLDRDMNAVTRSIRC